MKHFTLVTFFLTLLFLFSCSAHYLPVTSNTVKENEDYAVLETHDYIIAVKYEYWYHDPQKLSEFYTTFYISIINKSKDNFEIKASDFTVLDQNQNQYDIILPEDVLKMYSENEFYFYDKPNFIQEHNQILEDKANARNNILNKSFSFSKIIPNAKKSGFIFINKIPYDNRQLSFFFNDMEVKFEKK